MLLLLCIYSLLTTVISQEIHTGPCPNISTQANFNVKRFSGQWYDIENTFFVGQMDKTCVTAIYTLRPDGKVDILNEDLTAEMHEENTTGIAYSPDQNDKSKLLVQLQDSKPANYWIIETDYENYALVWSCETLVSGLLHGDIAWILGRKTTLSKEIVNRLKKKLNDAGINTDGFKPVVNENCPW